MPLKKPLKKKTTTKKKRSIKKVSPISNKPKKNALPLPAKSSTSRYVCYTLKEIFDKKIGNDWGKGAINALTEAFSKKKRLAIVDKNVEVKRIPKVWYSLSDYIEIDGVVYKGTWHV